MDVPSDIHITMLAQAGNPPEELAGVDIKSPFRYSTSAQSGDWRGCLVNSNTDLKNVRGVRSNEVSDYSSEGGSDLQEFLAAT
jgi:hypothetical protein